MTPTDTKSETPRTDAWLEDHATIDDPFVYSSFARQLERELTQTKALLERMVTATYELYTSGVPGQGMVLCNVCGAIGEAELHEHPHEEDCPVREIDKLLAEYAALTNGKEEGK